MVPDHFHPLHANDAELRQEGVTIYLSFPTSVALQAWPEVRLRYIQSFDGRGQRNYLGVVVPEKPALEVFVEQEGDVAVATLKGPIDSATLDIFQDKVGPLCSRSGGRVLLDCRELSYINSRGIGLLMKYHRGLMVSRGHFALCSLNPKLVRTLDLLQIGKALASYPGRAEALAALR